MTPEEDLRLSIAMDDHEQSLAAKALKLAAVMALIAAICCIMLVGCAEQWQVVQFA